MFHFVHGASEERYGLYYLLCHRFFNMRLYFYMQDKSIQQCFFTSSAVYVVCVKATEGLKGVVELEGWLLGIKVSQSFY